MKNNPLLRLDRESDLRERLLTYCRLERGQVWDDPEGRHRVGCLDAGSAEDTALLMGTSRASLAIQDPPYNMVAFETMPLSRYIAWCEQWVRLTLAQLTVDSSFYVWLGADQNHGFRPLPDFMVMMRSIPELVSRSFITMRNQRGFGTQKNWMAVRQELLYYTRGNPEFTVQYTDIPKILRGYYKKVQGRTTENLERSKSPNIRAGNVWVDIQQVFYRMQENVSGCYAQKPLKAIERIILASSRDGDAVLDCFAHSGTTLLACERLGRRCFTMDTDPVYCEIAIRRLEQFRAKGLLGWQNGNPFEADLASELEGQHVSDSQGDRRAALQPTLF
jgi:site-specific DNA-methyltransferase (adenine-specific)